MRFGAKQRGESERATEPPVILADMTVPVDSATNIPMKRRERVTGTMISKGRFKKLSQSLKSDLNKFQILPRRGFGLCSLTEGSSLRCLRSSCIDILAVMMAAPSSEWDSSVAGKM